jgi:hypothetical protein
MPNVLTIDSGGVGQGVRVNEREKIIRYNCVLSGNYVQAVRGSNVGELLDLTKVVGALQADQFWGISGPIRGYPLQGPGGSGVEIIPGADRLHWLLKMFAVGANNEFAAGAYPASVLADLDFYVEFSGRRFD